jgi:hypothetical protein
MAEIYNHFPRQEVTLGEWLEFDLKFDGYDSSTYTLTYTFVGNGKNFAIICTSNDDGSYHFESEVYEDAGVDEYQYQGVAELDGKRFFIDSGRVTTIPNFASLRNGKDNRSHVKKTLDALEAMIEGKANSDQIYYMIEGRALSRIPPSELMDWYLKYKALYAQELRIERAKHGKVTGKIQVAFR